MGKSGRLVVVVVLGSILFGVPLGLRAIGSRGVDDARTRILARAAEARVDQDRLLMSFFGEPGSELARALGVDESDIVSMQSRPPVVCVVVQVKRLIVDDRVRLVVNPDGSVEPTSTC